MARKASSLSCRSSLTRTKNSSFPGAGAPLLNEFDLDNAAWVDSEDSLAAGPFNQEVCGMKSVGTTCSKESSVARLTFKAWRCFVVGPVLRVLLNRLTRSFDTPSSGAERVEGSQRGNSRGVAGGGGSRDSLLSYWRAAGVESVSNSHISCMSST